jgi:hypothetical protein
LTGNIPFDRQPPFRWQYPQQADRNIDAIVLTTNLSDIKMRALNEQGSVPLDGLFTQRNKVFMKVTNHGNEDMTLTVPFCAYVYYTH